MVCGGYVLCVMVCLPQASRTMLCRCCSVAKLCLTLCDPMDCGTSSFPVLHYLPESVQIHVRCISDNHLILCCLQSFSASWSFPKSWLFASGSQSIGASASASVFPSEYSGLISFRIDWLDLLAVQGPLKSLLHHHSLKASVLCHSAFFWPNAHIHT